MAVRTMLACMGIPFPWWGPWRSGASVRVVGTCGKRVNRQRAGCIPHGGQGGLDQVCNGEDPPSGYAGCALHLPIVGGIVRHLWSVSAWDSSVSGGAHLTRGGGPCTDISS
jgi:hypothetical protein